MAVVTLTDAQGRSDVVRNETETNANTCERVGSLFRDMVDSMWPYVGGNVANTDGGTNVSMTLLATDHAPGMYEVSPYIRVGTAGTFGTVKADIITDEGTVEAWAPQTIAEPGPLVFHPVVVHSGGTASIRILFTFANVAGTPAITLRGALKRSYPDAELEE